MRKTFLLTHEVEGERLLNFYLDTLHDANVLAYQLMRLELQKLVPFKGAEQKLYISIGGFIPNVDGPDHGQEYLDNRGRTFHQSAEGTDRVIFLAPPEALPIMEDHAKRFDMQFTHVETNLPVDPDKGQRPLLMAVGFNAMLCGGDTLPHTWRFASKAYQINGKLMVNKTKYPDHQLEHYIADLYMVLERKPSLYDTHFSPEAVKRNREFPRHLQVGETVNE